MSDSKEENFNLPKHDTREECYDEYEEKVDSSGHLVRHDVKPTSPNETGATPGYSTELGKRFSLANISSKAKVKVYYDDKGRKKTNIKAPKSAWVHNLIYLEGEKFSFEGRNYLHPIYNSNSKRILLKTGRQVEKTVLLNSNILMSDGSYKKASNIKLGDHISSLNVETQKIEVDTISWVSRIYRKSCRRIKTRLGHIIEVAHTHPVRTWEDWTEASNLNVGDKVATVRRAGSFNNYFSEIRNEEVEVLALMIGDGQLKNTCRFFQNESMVLDRFKCCLKELNIDFKERSRSGYPLDPHKYISFSPFGLLKREKGRSSSDKRIPPEIFQFSKEKTALFLNRLWAADGHVKRNSKSKFSIEYCSISKELILGVQSLLWKFGIPSKIRENTSTLYKSSANSGKVAYILRIETLEGVKTFLNEIGALGKSESISLDDLPEENNNRDCIPKEISSLLREVDISNGIEDKRGPLGDRLYKYGLRLSPKYNLTHKKLKEYVNFFKEQGDRNPQLIEKLSSHLDSDIYWDEIVEIEEIGELECIDFTAPKNHNFIVSGVVTHNSTLLANNLTIMCAIRPFFRCLYVSPSHVQTRTFSNDKLKPVLERSPMIARYLQDNKVSTQVFEKGFTNGAFIFLRSAFLSADRARGISSDLLCYDKDAYALTKNGWKKFSDLVYSDEIATRNPNTGILEWHKPSRIIKKYHTGKMVTFKHMGFHIRVTDNHDMLINWAVKPYLENKWEKVKALDLFTSKKMGFKLGNPVHWDKKTPEFKEFKPWQVTQRVSKKYKSNMGTRINTYPGLKIPYLKFAEIIGWYLSEGFMTGTGSSIRACLILNKKKDLHLVERCLNKSNLTYSIGKGSTDETVVLTLNSSHLALYLSDNRGAYNKFIPREILDYPEATERLLYGLYKGGACYHKGEDWKNGTLRTRSRKLAEDSQEAWLRIGRPAVLHERMAWNKHQDSKDYDQGKMVPLYEVCSYNRDYMIFLNSQKKDRIIEEDVINEEVFCVTVPNNELIVKGDFNSKPIVSGNCLDEVQDLIMGNIPVIAQCLSHSRYGYHVYAGTPKSLDNTIEQIWQTTSQNEWMVRCTACRKDNFLDIRNIGKRGPICKKCGKDLDVTNGRWMRASNNTFWDGYRIPQLMVPWIAKKDSDSWKQLVHQMETYPESQFYNEVLGLSFDNAAKPITRADVLACCSPQVKIIEDPYNLSRERLNALHKRTLFAGVDWGEGNDGTGTDIMGKIKTASYTVLTIGGYVGGGKFRVYYMKRYKGKETDPDFVVNDIVKTCAVLGVKMIGADWGHGWGVNNTMFRKYGPQRCAQFMYVDRQKEVRKWDAIGYKFQLMRNHVMSEIFYAFKEGMFEFPPLEKWEHFAKDMFNISVEYIEYQRTLRYVHRPSDPDDWFHSLLYCKQVADVYHGKR